MKAIILVGGMGTRLRPLTLDRPKSLLPIAGLPFLAYQFNLLRAGGVKRICLAVGRSYKKWEGKIKKYAPPGVCLTFSRETKPMGTGGAVRLAAEHLGWNRTAADEFVVLNGDVFLALDVKKFVADHRRKKSEATVALTRVPDVSRYGWIDRSAGGRIRRFREKCPIHRPGFVNAGAYVLSGSFINLIPKRPCSIEKETFPLGLARGRRMFAFPLRGYWNDIGRPESYVAVHGDLFSGKAHWTDRALFRKTGSLRRKGRSLIWTGKNVKVRPSSRLEGVVSLESGVSVGKECRITDSILHEDCRIGDGAVIRRSIIGRMSRIGNHAVLDGAVVGKGTKIPDYSKI